MELIPQGTKIDFIGKKWFFFLLSLVLIIGSIWIWFDKGESKYGTDFSGGHEFLVSFKEEVGSEEVRTALAKHQLPEAHVQAFKGADKLVSIRLGGNEDVQKMRADVQAALTEAFKEVSIVKTDFVGPTVGKELRTSALLAIGLGLLGILIYIGFRFELAVGVGTIVALFHDVIISTGVYIAAGHLISMSTLAAALTIVGYSVNDTVVVFDRVRSERQKRSGDLGVLVNDAINFTLSRTLITHILTLFSALALYIFGGGDIADLSLYLVAGIVCGSYSTIFIASPIVIMLENWREGNKRGKVTVGSKVKKTA